MKQLMNLAFINSILRDLQNSSYPMKAKFNKLLIIFHSKYFPVSDWLKPHA